MSKKTAGFLLVLDLAFLAVVGYLTWQRYSELQQPAPPPPAPIEAAPIPAPEPVVVSTETAAVDVSTATVEAVASSSATAVAVSTPVAAVPVDPAPAAAKPAVKATRFTYYSRNAKQVQIVGDFNNWAPQDFRRNAKGGWVISLPIPPGDYSYNYLVDGKTVRDPNQPRTDNQGRSLLSLPRPAASTTNP